jgi:hypothetical protein
MHGQPNVKKNVQKIFGGKSMVDFHHPTKPELTSVKVPGKDLNPLLSQLNANSVLGYLSAHRGPIRDTTAMA